MTLEQFKAEEIVLKFHKVNNLQGICNMTIHEAKECAKIHVRGIIDANPIIPLTYMLESESLDAAREFWNEVLKEIDNL